jgi:hypothetical protein
VEKSPGMGAKIGHDLHILSTSKKKFFPVLIRVSKDF